MARYSRLKSFLYETQSSFRRQLMWCQQRVEDFPEEENIKIEAIN